jgi:hypothetical protein
VQEELFNQAYSGQPEVTGIEPTLVVDELPASTDTIDSLEASDQAATDGKTETSENETIEDIKVNIECEASSLQYRLKQVLVVTLITLAFALYFICMDVFQLLKNPKRYWKQRYFQLIDLISPFLIIINVSRFLYAFDEETHESQSENKPIAFDKKEFEYSQKPDMMMD